MPWRCSSPCVASVTRLAQPWPTSSTTASRPVPVKSASISPGTAPAAGTLVLDDGRGMDDAELESAMRLGDKNPLDTRSAQDLGRFGMGLKTASFSQCRRLTVATIKGGVTSCLRWDLDELAADPMAAGSYLRGQRKGQSHTLRA